MTASYITGAELADLAVTWQDASGTVVDFSSGWTFQVKVGANLGTAAEFTKTTGITGAATAPNVTIAWATSGELNDLDAGTYVVQIAATRTSDSKTRIMHTPLQIVAALT